MELFHGDCLEVMTDIPDKSIDMVLCDLPYGSTACKWDSIISFNELWSQYKRVVKENGAIVLFSIQPFTTKLIHSNFKDYRYNWYWKKNNATGGQFSKIQPMRCIEDICVFYGKKPTYNPQGLVKLDKPITNRLNDKTDLWIFRGNPMIQEYTNYPKHLLEFKRDREKLHPTQKPVALLEYLVKTYTHAGDTVLDNCMGSGSTGVACANTGRSFIGIEKEYKYFKIAKERIEDALFNLGKKEGCS